MKTTLFSKQHSTLFDFVGATAHSNAYFGEGSGAVHLDLVQCTGSEYNLTECETGNSGPGDSPDHSLDVGVKCQPGMWKTVVKPFIIHGSCTYLLPYL